MDQPSNSSSGGGIDMARTALRAARKAAAARGNAPAKRTASAVPRPGRHGRDAREPAPIADVFTALVAAYGWTLGTAGGGLRDRWPSIVGPDAASHWHLAGYNPTTRRLRVIADSPAWAAQLRYRTRTILTTLEQLRPRTVTAIDVRIGPAPAAQPDQGSEGRPARRDDRRTAQPAQPPLADRTVYQALRRRMREDAAARQAAADQAAADREELLRRHYNRLREPEGAHRTAVEDIPVTNGEHARRQRARPRAAFAVAGQDPGSRVPTVAVS